MYRKAVVVVPVVVVVAAQVGKVEGFPVDTMTCYRFRCLLCPGSHPDRCGSVRNPETCVPGNPVRRPPVHRFPSDPIDENIKSEIKFEV